MTDGGPDDEVDVTADRTVGDDPWQPPVDHPGKKYEALAEEYESEGAGSPSAPSRGDAPAVSATLQTRFWLLVLVFNLALLGLSVGAMFLVFENDWTVGSQLFVGGAILFVFGLYRYRQVRRRLDSGEFGEETDSE